MKQLLCTLAIAIGLSACIKTVPQQEPNPIPSPSTSSTPMQTTNETSLNTAKWKEHTLPAVGITFKLPPSLDFLGEVRQQIAAGETGTQLCVQFSKPAAWYNKLIPIVEAGGGCSTEPNSYIYMGTTSVDYAAGREGAFTDIQGFAKQNEKYLIRFVDNKFLETFDQDQITPITNLNGVEVIKIKSKIYPDDGPSLRNSLGGRVGGIVNTKNKTYPGFDFVFEKTISESEVDGILSSVKLTK